jgi:deoxyribonuclease-4
MIGAHISTAGGLELAPGRARELGCEAVQIFTRNQRQWRSPVLDDARVAAFRRAVAASGVKTVFSHDSYLVNFASANRSIAERSVEAFVGELERCETLGLAFVVTHPGSPGSLAGGERGIAAMARGLDRALRRTRGFRTRVLLETSAGQGSCVGSTFEELAAIIDSTSEPERVGVCLDTCHVLAAGYDVRTRAGLEDALASFDAALGLERLGAFHLNDSKRELGSRVDRHEHIGRGQVGLETFRLILRDPRFRDVPKVIETPKEGDMDPVNLGLLRELASGERSISRRRAARAAPRSRERRAR